MACNNNLANAQYALWVFWKSLILKDIFIRGSIRVWPINRKQNIA